MKEAIEGDVIVSDTPCQSFSEPRCPRRFSVPNLVVWSLDQADVTELTGQARTDYERELRISAIGKLLESTAATPLWRRVCKHSMYSEIRLRSDDQRVAMELVRMEQIRGRA
ncbi:hypothetical protein [Burkholderia stagnalis]|uniref:hypothetical protein n=1 Tax=Burkholderia stagnalis TaxID=1503054 RepID=UPI000F562D71|nr:hypothetical protein [Burkholderia stagnalis]